MILLVLGVVALLLDWAPEERLTTAGTVSETGLNHGALAVDSWGRVTAAWAEQDGPNNNFRVHARTREVNGLWGPTEVAVDYLPSYAGTGLGAKFPALAYLPGDTLLVVWHDYRVDGIRNLELFTKVRAPGAAWGDSASETRLTTSLHPETNGDNSYVPSLVLDPSNTAHVVWYDYRYEVDHAEILFKSRTGGAWDTTSGDAPDLNLSLNAGDSQFPAIAAGPDGALHVAWRDNAFGAYGILYLQRSPEGTWGDFAFLSAAGAPADGVALACDADGTLLAVWSDAREGVKAVFSRERLLSGVWGPPMRVSPPGVGAEEPDVAIDASGRRHVVWHDARLSLFNRTIYHQAALPGAPWDSTGASDARVSDGASGKSSRPTLRLHAGRAFVLWQDARHGAEEIYFRAAADPNTAAPSSRLRPVVVAVPSPFRSRVVLSGVPEAVREIRIVDGLGRLRAALDVGFSEVAWDGRDASGSLVPAGVYFVTGRADGTSWVPLGRVVRRP